MKRDLIPSASIHAVRFFEDERTLLEDVCHFISTGYELGDAAVIAVSREHASAIRRELQQRGYGRYASEVVFLDAEHAAEAFGGGAGFDAGAFDRLIEPEISSAASRSRNGRARAYGEIVDILWAAGKEAQAFALERLWHAACARHRLRMLCGYRLGLLDCRCFDVASVHDAVVAPRERAFDREKVRRVLEAVLGRQARSLRAHIAAHAALSTVPFEQAALIWIGRHMPAVADEVSAALESSGR